MKTNIIVSYHRRPENLKTLIRYLLPLLNENLTMIIVEWNYKPTVRFSHKFVKYYWIESEDTFNKGKCYNYGVSKSDGDYLIFHDVDIILKRKSYQQVNMLNEYDVIDPYKEIIYLNKESTQEFIKDFKIELKPENIDNKCISGVISGGVFFIKKDKYLEVKGFDEKCVGYGHEDDIFDVKIKLMKFKINRIGDICIHLWHEIDKEYHNKIVKNKELYDKYLKMNKYQLIKYLS